ncbi:MAG TPA: GYF domain-containing protein, partial [Polyangiales bacterium]|nr:GYF domain-containing protein [Polyangiales bacterium]
MKIVCGSCQAKYSIADEKVAGKVFRIRCKRCGEVIVVRGDQDSPEAGVTVAANGNGQAAQAPAAAAEAPSDGIWHVVINGEQAGPYSPQQLGELVASGQLDWEAYVWSEGFENWQPMREVPDLVNAISGGQGVPVAGRPTPAANSQMGADPFPEEAPAQQPVVFAKAAGGGGGVVQQPTNPRLDSPTALS